MIKLNLISPKQQSYLRLRDIYHSIENCLTLIIITAILIVAALIPISRSLTALNKEIIDDKEQTMAKNKILTYEINNLNEKIETLNSVQTDYYNWPQLLANFSNLVPEDVTLVQFNAQLKSHQFSIQGYAKDRDSFLTFKNSLDQSGFFYNLESPLSDILKKQDITFEIKGYFK